MKFIVTTPALPNKHIEVESESALLAVYDALNITVWPKADWEKINFSNFLPSIKTELICNICYSECERKFNNGNGAWVCTNCRRMQ